MQPSKARREARRCDYSGLHVQGNAAAARVCSARSLAAPLGGVGLGVQAQRGAASDDGNNLSAPTKFGTYSEF